jgi:hypothetical protein
MTFKHLRLKTNRYNDRVCFEKPWCYNDIELPSKKEGTNWRRNECFKITQTLGPNINNFPSKKKHVHEFCHETLNLNPKHVPQISMVKFQSLFKILVFFRIK